MSDETRKPPMWDTASVAESFGVPRTIICPRVPPKFPLHLAHCSCGFICSATSDDSTDAALFAHVVACHTVPPPDPDR